MNYQIEPGKTIKIQKYNPEDLSWWLEDKKSAKKELKEIRKKLIRLQRLLYAERIHKLLIVLQAMDSGGKDGTIRSIFKGVNPQGVKVANYKVPTPIELAHDYLWRVHVNTPGRGEIVIFNRSHYEDVLVVRVHNLVPKTVWEKRYEQINNFEKLLADEGTIILKFFLHISKEEQRERFLERIENPEKQWKFKPNDIEERKLWDEHMKAYQDAINKTSTTYAPWFIIPANHNWYRDLVIAKIVTGSLESLKMKYPQPEEDIQNYSELLRKE